MGNPYIPEHFLSPGSYRPGHVARIHRYTCHHLEPLDLGAASNSHLAKLLMHGTTQCIVVLECDLYWNWRFRVPSYTPSLWSRRPPSESAPPSSSAMCLLRRSLITWSPEFTSGDFIFNWVTAGIGVIEIGARQLNNWRLHEPPTSFPSASLAFSQYAYTIA